MHQFHKSTFLVCKNEGNKAHSDLDKHSRLKCHIALCTVKVDDIKAQNERDGVCVCVAMEIYTVCEVYSVVITLSVAPSVSRGPQPRGLWGGGGLLVVVEDVRHFLVLNSDMDNTNMRECL